MPEGDPTQHSTLGPINYDKKNGKGNVPYNQEIGYKGFACLMRPQQFLALAAPRVEYLSLTYLKKWIKAGKPIGSPFLGISFESLVSVVSYHDGRTRIKAIQSIYGDIPVLVHIIAYGSKASAINDNLINSARLIITPEKSNLPAIGPWFEPRIWHLGKWKPI